MPNRVFALENTGSRVLRLGRVGIDPGYQEGPPSVYRPEGLTTVTFTRATAASYMDVNGVLQDVASGTAREQHRPEIADLAHVLMEIPRTRVVTNPEDFSLWVATGTPTLTGGQADPYGGTAAYLLEDDAASVELIHEVISFTGDGTKAVAVFLREGTAQYVQIALRDITAVTNRFVAEVEWISGVPSVSLVSGQGAGNIFPTLQLANGWWRIMFAAFSVVAANTNHLQIIPSRGHGPSADPSATGNVYIFGANAWNEAYPASYQGPSLATRNRDQMVQAFTPAPQAMSGYIRFTELAKPSWLQDASVAPRLLHFGNDANSNPKLFLHKPDGLDLYRISHTKTAGTEASSVDLNPDYGDEIELFFQVFDDGSVQLSGRKNGGSTVVGTRSDPHSLETAWSAQEMHICSRGAAGAADVALRGVVVKAGVDWTFDELANMVGKDIGFYTYVGKMRSESISPAGESGLCLFRRVALRMHHTGAFEATVRVYVDGVQTKVYDASSSLVDQEVEFAVPTPTAPPLETVLEASISAKGTSIEVELEMSSDDVQGIALPESMDVHFHAIREAKSRGAESE